MFTSKLPCRLIPAASQRRQPDHAIHFFLLTPLLLDEGETKIRIVVEGKGNPTFSIFFRLYAALDTTNCMQADCLKLRG